MGGASLQLHVDGMCVDDGVLFTHSAKEREKCNIGLNLKFDRRKKEVLLVHEKL